MLLVVFPCVIKYNYIGLDKISLSIIYLSTSNNVIFVIILAIAYL